jgi:hypothetical protein
MENYRMTNDLLVGVISDGTPPVADSSMPEHEFLCISSAVHCPFLLHVVAFLWTFVLSHLILHLLVAS